MLGDFIVASTLSRAFAKAFELVGVAAGGLVGGAVGFTFDLTHKALKEVCVNYLKFYDDHPELRRNADPELVKCLLELPPTIFKEDLKNKIRYTTGDEKVAENRLAPAH
jgi:hypothetical protein